MDANEYAGQISPPQKSLALVIRKAEWMGNGKAPKIATVADDVEMREILPSLAAKNKPEQAAGVEAPPVNPVSNAPPQEQQLNEQATPVPALPPSGVAVTARRQRTVYDLGRSVVPGAGCG